MAVVRLKPQRPKKKKKSETGVCSTRSGGSETFLSKFSLWLCVRAVTSVLLPCSFLSLCVPLTPSHSFTLRLTSLHFYVYTLHFFSRFCSLTLRLSAMQIPLPGLCTLNSCSFSAGCNALYILGFLFIITGTQQLSSSPSTVSEYIHLTQPT